MIEITEKPSVATTYVRPFGRLRHEMVPALLRRRVVGAAVLASVLAVAYWMLGASDRYVSEAHVIIQRTDLAGSQSMDFSSLIAGMGAGSRADQLLLRDHLRSVDMLIKVDAALNLRAHYSDKRRDPLSRMWFEDASIEWFHNHYLSRVGIEFDDYSGILVIKAQAYDPETAHDITALLVREGGRFMNSMAHQLAQAQVTFLEQQVVQMNERALQSRRAVLEYQEKKGLLSPQATSESIGAIVARLQALRTDLQTQRGALRAYLIADHPSVVLLDQQIAAIERQLAQEQARLTSPGGQPLNRAVEEFQRLEAEAVFRLDIYKTALVALEKGRIEATRTIKDVSVLQAPTHPQYALEPRRIYNSMVFILVVMVLAGVAHLMAAIVRDHKD